MGDHLALLVDRLLTKSTLEAAIGSRIRTVPLEDPGSEFSKKKSVRDGSSAPKLAECRICHDEDEESNMESPCSCCGSLKYAHRKCVQKWCNEKGDTLCEICLQQFKPGYTAPPQLFQYGSIPMNFRGSWEISRQDLHDSQIITMVPSEREYDDYSASSTRSTVCCRSVAIIFMVLLVLRHALPLMISGTEEYSFTLFSVNFCFRITHFPYTFAGSLYFSDYILKLLLFMHTFFIKAGCIEGWWTTSTNLCDGESPNDISPPSSSTGISSGIYISIRRREHAV